MLAALYREAVMMRDDLERINPQVADRPGRPGSGISAFIAPFNRLLARTQAAVAGDPIVAEMLHEFGALGEIDETLSAHYHTERKYAMMVALGRVIAVLTPLVSEFPATPPMTATREGVFFAGEYYEPIRLAAGLISEARRSLVIIDGYLGNGQLVLDLLKGKAPGVTVSLLTYEETLQPPLLALAQAFQREHGGLSLRTSRAFHDRFIIIDDRDFYHFGASLKDMGTRGFMFSRIEEPEIMEKVRTKFVAEWERAVIKI